MTDLDRYAVFGHPVQHSLSPQIHQAFAEQTGQRLAYTRLWAPLDGFDAVMRAFVAGGGRGANVTVPFKFEALRLATRRSARAELAQAANVLTFDGEEIHADNSDGVGLVRDIESGAGRPLAGQRVLLVGAGGAGAGVLGPLLQAAPAELVVVNRTDERAQDLVLRHAELAREGGVRLHTATMLAPGAGFDVVINASASSLEGAAPSPVPEMVLRPGTLAVDLMYGPKAEPFMDWARRHGAEPRDGLGMLVEQAAEAFELWRGVRPDTAPVMAALRALKG